MIVYRLASFATPLRTLPARIPGRYHGGEEDSPTQYLCVHPLGPFAEFMRANTIRSPEQVRQVRERTWALDVRLDDLQRIDFDDAAEFGVEAADLVADDPRRCQELAAGLRDELSGIVVPSAALPGTSNIVLFGPRVGSPYLLEPIGAIDVPASITADGGRPSQSLLGLVCFRGGRHAALEAWKAGDPFVFEEPSWDL